MKNKSLGVFFILCFWCGITRSQIVSPFNHLSIKSSSEYAFLVSGHFHGASNNQSTFPASTLLANIDTLNSLNASFLMCLGDMFLDVDEKYISHYRKSLFDKLKIPLLNAVGNHDLFNDNLYGKVFGKTFYTFRLGSELFIVLNTENNDGSITGEQLRMFRDSLSGSSLKNIKNVFVFSHRPLWAEELPAYSKLFKENTRTAIGKNNFRTDLEPILKTVASNKNVYWISGSMGGGASSFFYDKDEETGITYMQTAIRDLPRDAVLMIGVNNGVISMSGISLTGEKLLPVEKYDLTYWNKTVPDEQKFNYRLMPLYIKNVLLSMNFWIGVLVSVVLIFSVMKLSVKWKRKK
jgi:hypothetical protein